MIDEGIVVAKERAGGVATALTIGLITPPREMSGGVLA
jgi:hypothetical protein